MRTRRIGSFAGGVAAAGVDFPGIAIPDPEGTRGRLVSGGISLLLHAAAISAILLAAWLAPEEMIEEIIEITRIEEELASEEPAPAPRVLAETLGRYDPAPMATVPQVVSPAVIQRATPVINAEQLQLDTLSPVQAPREVQRASRQVETARTYQSIAQATVSPLEIDASAPAIRGPVELHAPSGIQAGPRQVARGSGVGIADPSALGSGSSVREGIASNRDVLGAKTGCPRPGELGRRRQQHAGQRRRGHRPRRPELGPVHGPARGPGLHAAHQDPGAEPLGAPRQRAGQPHRHTPLRARPGGHRQPRRLRLGGRQGPR